MTKANNRHLFIDKVQKKVAMKQCPIMKIYNITPYTTNNTKIIFVNKNIA